MAVTLTDKPRIDIRNCRKHDPNLTIITCQQIKISFVIGNIAKQKYLPQENNFTLEHKLGRRGQIKKPSAYHNSHISTTNIMMLQKCQTFRIVAKLTVYHLMCLSALQLVWCKMGVYLKWRTELLGMYSKHTHTHRGSLYWFHDHKISLLC